MALKEFSVDRLRVSVVVFAFLISTFNLSCVHGSKRQYSEAPSGQAFLSPSPDFQSLASLSKWSEPLNEQDKIGYLLERMAHSDDRFIRNGEIYDGKKARQWLLYKMFHWTQGVETADDFVNLVATYSQKTGSPYLVEFQDGKIYTLKSLLRNELTAFESRPHPKPGHVPLSSSVSTGQAAPAAAKG